MFTFQIKQFKKWVANSNSKFYDPHHFKFHSEILLYQTSGAVPLQIMSYIEEPQRTENWTAQSSFNHWQKGQLWKTGLDRRSGTCSSLFQNLKVQLIFENSKILSTTNFLTAHIQKHCHYSCGQYWVSSREKAERPQH